MKLWILLAALPAMGQFGGLATNADGSELVFVSPLRQSGTEQPRYGKVFRLDDRQLRAELVIPVEKVDEQWSNFYDVRTPYLDEKGRLAGVNATRTCSINFYQACKAFDGSNYGTTKYLGRLFLSSNRRFALNEVWGGLSLYGYSLLDLSTGRVLATANDFSTGPIVVTDEGVVWRAAGAQVQKLSSGNSKFEEFRFDQASYLEGLDVEAGEGKLFTWNSNEVMQESQLVEIQVKAGTLSPVGDPIKGYCSKVKQAANGTLLGECTKDGAQRLLRLDGGAGAWRQVTEDLGKDWTVSGDGRVLWFLTKANAIHKSNLLEETDETRMPPIGSIDPSGSPGAPGSLFYVGGAGLKDYRLDVLRDGKKIGVLNALSKSDEQLIYLLPWVWDGPLASYMAEMVFEGPSWFEVKVPLAIGLDYAKPQFFDIQPSGTRVQPTGFALKPLAAHGDFQNLVDAQHPVQPGEVIHFWALNLGPVVKSADGLSRITKDFRCYGTGGAQMPALYAGLAPNLTGVYQVTVQLPDLLPPREPTRSGYALSCGFFASMPVYAFLPY